MASSLLLADGSSGILPYTKSSFEDFNCDPDPFSLSESARLYLVLGGLFGWDLPSHGEAYDHCGTILSDKGCLNVSGHSQLSLDFENTSGKIFVKRYAFSCDRAECPVCYEKWASKRARKIEGRILAFKKPFLFGNPIHVVVSVPPSLYGLAEKGYEKLRGLVYGVLKEVGFKGGSCIYHPFRKSEFNSWYFSPHFHVIGYGWIKGDIVSKVYRRENFIIKNLGTRESVFATAMYQLSHAGIHSDYHTITWFGCLSYNKFSYKEQKEVEVCPICGQELKNIVWVGGVDNPR